MHTACGGVEPATTMPVVFDVGTDNEELLRSPLYVGVRHRCEMLPSADAMCGPYVLTDDGKMLVLACSAVPRQSVSWLCCGIQGLWLDS